MMVKRRNRQGGWGTRDLRIIAILRPVLFSSSALYEAGRRQKAHHVDIIGVI